VIFLISIMGYATKVEAEIWLKEARRRKLQVGNSMDN